MKKVYISELLTEATEGMQSFTEQDILDAIDKQFGQRNVYMWSTYILPNGHFLNPEKGEQSGNLTYEHADFDNWVDDIFGNEGIRVLDRNSIKMNVTYPYLYLPEERITANQVLAIRQVLNKKDEFEYAVYDIADKTDNPNVLELLEPILIQTKNDDAVFDLSYQSASDIVKAISRYYSLGTFLNESKGLNEGLVNNKQGDTVMEREEKNTITLRVRVGYVNTGYFGEDYFETEEEYTEQVADMEAARQLLEEEYGNIFNIVTKHNGDIVAWVY